MKIIAGKKSQARSIARLIMQAMSYDCCKFLVGPDHILDDFEEVMTILAGSEIAQYSYLNTITAVDDEGIVCGICVSYDGGQLHTLRKAFIDIMFERCQRDFSNIKDETSAGELYVDSLAVVENERNKGIGTALLHCAIAKAKRMNMPAVGLLVDANNTRAERLYHRVGFEFVNVSMWGGHAMRHLQYKIRKD